MKKTLKRISKNKGQRGGCGCDNSKSIFKGGSGGSFMTPSYDANSLNSQYSIPYNTMTGSSSDAITQLHNSRLDSQHTITPNLMGGRGGKKRRGKLQKNNKTRRGGKINKRCKSRKMRS
jgi:hypothetical protein